MLKEYYKKLIDGESPIFAFGIISIISALIFLVIPWLLVKPSVINGFDFSKSGPIGDTIGGITNPLIALVAAILTFLAFWVQYQANIKYENQFDKQDRSTKLDRFSTNYFEQLRLHRENVQEFNIEDKVYGRKCFQPMFYEFKFCYYALLQCYNRDMRNGILNQKLNEEDLINISYITFYTGIGENSESLAFELLYNYERGLLLNYFEYLKACQSNNEDLVGVDKDSESIFTMKRRYKLFEGHTSRLGHYFRHLFQMVNFIDEQDNKIVEDKQQFAKTIRAQLSNFEQLLLFYNSLSIIGKAWNEKKYIQTYNLIKNIPLAYADFGITPIEKYGKFNSNGQYNFEWNEIQDIVKINKE